MTLDNKQLTTIIVLRGLGYSQQEISNTLHISRKSVENWLRKLKHESISNGIYTTYSKHVNAFEITLNQVREEIKKEL